MENQSLNYFLLKKVNLNLFSSKNTPEQEEKKSILETSIAQSEFSAMIRPCFWKKLKIMTLTVSTEQLKV